MAKNEPTDFANSSRPGYLGILKLALRPSPFAHCRFVDSLIRFIDTPRKSNECNVSPIYQTNRLFIKRIALSSNESASKNLCQAATRRLHFGWLGVTFLKYTQKKRSIVAGLFPVCGGLQ